MELDFSLRQLHWWTQGCSSRVFDVQRRERYQVLQRFVWGIKVELYDDSKVLQARLRERLPFGRTFDLTLFDHAEVPRLSGSIEFALWPRADFTLSDGRSVSVRGELQAEANAITIRCGEMVLQLELFGTLTEERHWAYGLLKGSNVEDEALAMALVLPVLATQPSD